MGKSFNQEWETVHSTQEWGMYPTEHVIRFIARNYYNVPEREKIKILDLDVEQVRTHGILQEKDLMHMHLMVLKVLLEEQKKDLQKKDYQPILRYWMHWKLIIRMSILMRL